MRRGYQGLFCWLASIVGEFGSHANLVFSPDAKWLASGEPHPGAVWQTQHWPEPIPLIPSPDNFPSPRNFAFSPDGRWLAGRVAETQIWLWEVSSWQVSSKIAQDGTIWDFAFSPDSQWLLTEFQRGVYPDTTFETEAQLWAVNSTELVAQLPHDVTGALEVTFSHKGDRIVISNGVEVRIWNFEAPAD
jgi:WD40 repeat protein